MSKEDIQKLFEELKSLETRVQENEIILQSQEAQKASLLRGLQPKYLDLKSQEKALEKRLQHLNEELYKRKDLENAFVKSLELGSKSKASVKIDNQSATMNILANLKNWDTIPDIVKKHLDEQDHILECKKAELSILEEKLQSRRKNAIKNLTIKLKSDKTLWEEEWEHKIDTESKQLKSTYEKQLSDLHFQKRLLEISLYKFTPK